jgi:uncharacterized lipoprotein NlpE involved in copper resistance
MVVVNQMISSKFQQYARGLLLVAVSFTLVGCNQREEHLALCDDAIESILKSVASYTRTDAKGDYRPQGARYVITYEAASHISGHSNETAVCAFDGGAAIITTNTFH